MNRIHLLALVLVLLTGCTDLIKPRFERVENVRVAEASRQRLVVTGDIVLFNPNPVAVRLTSMDLSLVSTGIQLADIDQTVEARLEPRTTSSIPLTVAFDPADLAGNGLDGLLNMGLSAVSDRAIPLVIEGDLAVGLGERTVTIPIRSEQQVDLAL